MQPAPVGAVCAIHVGVPASLTCARCGNFMCSTCAEHGAQAQCPSCRALQGDEFPLTAGSDLSAMWGHSQAAWQRELLMLSVATVIFFAISFAGGVISNIITEILNAIVGLEGKLDPKNPFKALGQIWPALLVGQLIGMLVSIVVQGVALVGLYRVLMDVLIGRKADLARMFSQLQVLPRYLVVQLFMFLGVSLPLIGSLVVIGIAAVAGAHLNWKNLEPEDLARLLGPQTFALFFAWFLMVLAVSVAILPVTLFSVPELIVSDCSPIEAITRAWNLGSGQRLRIFGYSFVSGLVVIVGFLACCVGVIPAMPLAYMILLALYLALRNSSGLPKAIH